MVKQRKRNDNKDEYFSTDVELNPCRPGRPARVFSSEEERSVFRKQMKKDADRRYKDKLKAEAEQGNAERYAAFKNRKQQQKARRYGNPRLLQQPTAAALLRLEQMNGRCDNSN
jgi:predicted ArsR family transcriptional regulator